MSTWAEVEEAAPALAAAVRERLLAHKHLTMATLRRDGAPRLCGTEVVLRDGQLWLAGMSEARRFADLRRDGRVALHSGSDDPPQWHGDARVSGRALEVVDPAELAEFVGGLDEQPPGSFELFRVDVTELVHVQLGTPADHIVVQSWREGRGATRVRRQ